MENFFYFTLKFSMGIILQKICMLQQNYSFILNMNEWHRSRTSTRIATHVDTFNCQGFVSATHKTIGRYGPVGALPNN